jgi:hypothetical protein
MSAPAERKFQGSSFISGGVSSLRAIFASHQNLFRYALVQLRADGETRLATILPGAFQADIELQMRLIKLSPEESETDIEQRSTQDKFEDGSEDEFEEEFEAVSYHWGSQKASVAISLNKHRFMVSPNVELMLRHLRRTREPRSIWIDAICIN